MVVIYDSSAVLFLNSSLVETAKPTSISITTGTVLRLLCGRRIPIIVEGVSSRRQSAVSGRESTDEDLWDSSEASKSVIIVASQISPSFPTRYVLYLFG
jgi:hypothetical protein